MRINADFSRQAIIDTSKSEWLRSPASGVDRIMLDRIGDEVARATSIVRYAQGSSFSRHEHAKGEEFLVLEGVFSDEHADYPTGTYVRNPPGSGHAPHSKHGCRILVKLRQFDPEDLQHVVVDTNDDCLWHKMGDDNAEFLALHHYGSERVLMLRLQSGVTYTTSPDGTEIFVVSGSIVVDEKKLFAESWLRLPEGYDAKVSAVDDVVLWVKHGHLPG